MLGEIGEQAGKRFREIASRLTNDAELQKDLVQEMFVHLLKVRERTPGKSFTWYVRSCEFRARNYLRLGRSVDSTKRAHNNVHLDPTNDGKDQEFYHEQFFHRVAAPAFKDSQNEVVTNDIYNLIAPRLSPMQKKIISLLMDGWGIREIARHLQVTHPAIIKHRKKIAAIAREYLNESACLPSVHPQGEAGFESKPTH